MARRGQRVCMPTPRYSAPVLPPVQPRHRFLRATFSACGGALLRVIHRASYFFPAGRVYLHRAPEPRACSHAPRALRGIISSCNKVERFWRERGKGVRALQSNVHEARMKYRLRDRRGLTPASDRLILFVARASGALYVCADCLLKLTLCLLMRDIFCTESYFFL